MIRALPTICALPFRLLAFCVSLAITTTPTWADVDTSPLSVTVERTFTNLQTKILRPIVLTHAGDRSNKIYVASQWGQIYSMANDREVQEAEMFADLSDRVSYKDRENEEGLLGLAFHPDYRNNGQLFVYYTSKAEPHTSVISRFQASDGHVDVDSEESIMKIKQPFWNHNGGTIVFGPDGYLYIALGDGGKANDPFNNGQNLQTLLGSILRIDINNTTTDGKGKETPYAIPEDNPFRNAKGLARPEIWAFGIRNVWRMAFDPETELLWAADVGQNLWEEIDIIQRGGNYGWNLREGKHDFAPNANGPRADLIEPIWEYDHETGKSITGGFVYRGKKVPALVGKYLYADYVAGLVWALDYDAESGTVKGNHLITQGKMPIISFGEDEQGEAYFTTDSHQIYRFESE